MKKILEVKNLEISFTNHDCSHTVVQDLSFDLYNGEILGIVGESGSGKTVTAHAIMGLIDPPGRIENGSILYHGQDILTFNPGKMHSLRGEKISIVFQELLNSLNPVFTCGTQIMDVVRAHAKCNRKTARSKCLKLLEKVGIPDPAFRMSQYPNQLSGGLRQRLIIAMAIAAGPEILIADEPTTALDVTVQAQILELFKTLAADTQCSIIIITHDLGSLVNTCDQLVVMYNGMIMEKISVEKLLSDAKHPYTRELLDSAKGIVDVKNYDLKNGKKAGSSSEFNVEKKIHTGCQYNDKCHLAMDICFTTRPEPVRLSSDHEASCFLLNGEEK